MNRKIQAISALFFGVLPIPALAQCNDQLSKNLQNILNAAVTDFREWANKAAGPDVSIEGTKVPCQTSTWANNVPMYICPRKFHLQTLQNGMPERSGVLPQLELEKAFFR